MWEETALTKLSQLITKLDGKFDSKTEENGFLPKWDSVKKLKPSIALKRLIEFNQGPLF